MSQSNFRVRKGLTVEGDSQTTGSATVNGSVILTGTTSGQVNVTAPAVAGSQAYTLPTGLPASNGYVLASQTDGTMSWVDNSAAGTTYTIDATSVTGGANFNLQGSDATTDTIKFEGSGATSVTRVDANTIAISSTDNNTTYTIDASSTTGGVNFNLVGSDLSNDIIKFGNGNGIAITTAAANDIKVALDPAADVTFNSVSTGTIKAADGTTSLTLANTTGNVTSAGTLTAKSTLQLNGSTSGFVSLTSPAVAGSQAYTLPTAYPGVSGYVLSSDTSGTLSWVANPDTNTTYTIDASSTTGGANFNLVGSDATTDTIKIANGTGVTATATDANTITVAIGQAVGTGSAVTFASVSTGTLKATDGTSVMNLVPTTGEAAFFGDISYPGRLLGSGSKTIRTGPNRVTGFSSISGATAEDIITIGIGASGIPVSGILSTNSALATGSTAGRRQGVLIRNYGSQEYNGASTTPPQGAFMCEESRGSYTDPRSTGSGQPVWAGQGFTNAGTDLASGNTPYWTAQQYPVSPAFGLVTNQIHKGPWGTGAAAAQFTADTNGTTLNVTAVSSGTIALGHEIRLSSGSNFPTTTNSYQIIAFGTGSGGIGTYTLNAAPSASPIASTSMFSTATTLGSQFFMNLQPQNTPLTTTSRAAQQISADNIIFRAQSANPAANIFSVNSWPTTLYAGTGTGTASGNFVQGSNKTYFSISDQVTSVNNILLANNGIIRTGPTALQLQDTTGTLLIGSNLTYNRVYGQWQNINTITPAASNTAYAFALPTTDFNNIASVNTTSRIVPGAAGMYKLQFSAQVRNDDSSAEHFAYFWWRKNGTDVPNSMGQVGVPKATGAGDALTIAGWDNMISSANATDYWELMYAVDDAAHVDFPTFGTTAFGPATAALFVTLVPIGA